MKKSLILYLLLSTATFLMATQTWVVGEVFTQIG